MSTSPIATPRSPSPWWRRAVIYQIYPRSFADGNGDGTGDLAGVRARLPYLKDLGVDAVWFTPWYASPLADGGCCQGVPNLGAIDRCVGGTTSIECTNLSGEFVADGLCTMGQACVE